MTRLFHWTFRLATTLVILSVAFSTLAYYLARQSLPQYSKTTNLPGLEDRLDIVRDTYNVPHIYGKSDHDTMFGLGYAHAQDRLWQMSILRRTAQGKLSEIFGAKTLSSDKFFRRLDIYSAAKKSYQVQSDNAKKLLDSLELYLRLKGRDRDKVFHRTARRNIKYVIKAIGNKNIKDISSSDGAKFRDWLLNKGLSINTVKRIFSSVRSIINIAIS